MTIKEDFLSLGKRARSGTKFTQKVCLIIIHWIGPYIQRITTPRDWWENGRDGLGVQASAHFIVRDNDVLQCLPLDEIGWHSGDTRNYTSIGIEMCPESLDGKLSIASILTLKKLIANIRTIYPDAAIERHFDGVQKKDCPRYYTPVIDLVGVDGRVPNPEGGDARWEQLKSFLNKE